MKYFKSLYEKHKERVEQLIFQYFYNTQVVMYSRDSEIPKQRNTN